MRCLRWSIEGATVDNGVLHFAKAIDLADQDGHTQILETIGSVLDPDILDSQEIFVKTLGPEEVGVALEGADDVVAVNLPTQSFNFSTTLLSNMIKIPPEALLDPKKTPIYMSTLP